MARGKATEARNNFRVVPGGRAAPGKTQKSDAKGPPVSAGDVARLMREKLAACGIDDAALARKAGLRALSARDIGELPVKPHGAGILIPYRDINGEETNYWHLRYLGEALPKDADGEDQKYASPRGAVPRVYFPPGLPWTSIAKDPAVPIIITEGEFKALSGAARGLVVLALGGVNSYRSKRLHTRFLPDLEAINWQRRPTYVLYDSDLEEKEEVQAAQLALAEELTKRGALPRLGFFPPPLGQEKIGLDDFIVAVEKSGDDAREAVEHVIAEARPYEVAERLWAMNDEVAFLKVPTAYVPTPTQPQDRPALWNERDLRQHYENRKVVVPQVTQKGVVMPEEDIDAIWRAWPLRREVEALTFEPGRERFIDGKLNTWSGWGPDGKLKPKHNAAVERAWKELVGYLFPQPDRRQWFEQFHAYKVQNPASKAHHAIVLFSEQEGVGKDLVCEAVAQLYGPHGMKITEGLLTSEFNGWLSSKMFLYATEVTGSDGYAHIDKVKGYVTSESDPINDKNQPVYTMVNRANFIFLTNRENAFRVGQNDRRFAIHRVTTKADKARYDAIAKVLKGPDGAAGLFHYLLRYDATGYKPTDHARQWDKQEAYLATLSAHESWIHEMAEAARTRDPGDARKDGLTGFLRGKCSFPEKVEVATVQDVLLWYRKSSGAEIKPETFAHALRRHVTPYRKGERVWIPALQTNRPVVILRNVEKWSKASPTAVAAQYAAQQAKPSKHDHKRLSAAQRTS